MRPGMEGAGKRQGVLILALIRFRCPQYVACVTQLACQLPRGAPPLGSEYGLRRDGLSGLTFQ